MRTISAGGASNLLQSWREMIFSVDRARRALPYLAIIIDELVDAYRSVQRSRRALEVEQRLSSRRDLIRQRDAAISKLNDVMDECDAVGVDLLDLHDGIVAFHCTVDDRPMSLLWRLGDPIRNAWQDFSPEPDQVRTIRHW